MTVIIPLWAMLAFVAALWIIILLKVAVEVMKYRVHKYERKNTIHEEALRMLKERDK